MGDTHRIVVTSRARAELKAATEYVRTHSSPDNAVAMAARILSAVDTLGALPHRYKQVGRSRAHGSPVHVLVVDPYLVYYRVDDRPAAVFVLTIWHGARRQPRRFE